MVSSAERLKQWWHDPVDHRWLVHVLERNSMLNAVRFSVGAGGLLLGVNAAATAASPAGPSGTVGMVVFGVVVAIAAAWTLRWWLLRWPSSTESLVLFAVADVTITVACLQDTDRVYGSLGLGELVITGSYLTFFHGPKVLAAHAAWAVLSVLLLTWRLVSHGGDVYLAVSIVLVVTTALVVALPSLQFMFWLVRAESLADPLTKLVNRRGLDFHLARLFDTRGPDRICVMIADLDRFKSVNDRFGHSVGDQVLIRTADQLRALAGPDLVVARTGGEEFVVAGPRCLATARADAEHFRRAVASDPDIPITVSIGVAVFDPTHDAFCPAPEDLLQRADLAMYQAKQLGGNRVVADEPLAVRAYLNAE